MSEAASYADLRLPGGGEDVDDAVERGGRVVGVQRGEHEVAGLGHGERGGDALGVAISPTSTTSGSSRRAARRPSWKDATSVPTFALGHERAAHAVHVLDRVLEGEDVAPGRGVDVADHGRLGGGLARAGGPGHEDEALLAQAQLPEDRGRSRSCMVGMARGMARRAMLAAPCWR
ncbi:MAG: hypothetical protein R2746_02495 [Acidimicrobiales bacterium]